MKNLKKEKGITLLALIITIVLLIIIATVSIRAITGDGIFENASKAKEEYRKEQYKETIQLALNSAKISTFNNKSGFLEEVKRILQNEPSFADASLSEITNDQFTIQTADNYSFVVRTDGVQSNDNSNSTESEIIFLTNYHTSEDEFECTDYCTIKVVSHYDSVLSFWKKEKVSEAQYESFLWNVYAQVKGNAAMQNILMTKGGSIENVPMSEIQSTLDEEVDPLIVAFSMYLVEYDRDLKIQGIIDGWKADHSESTANSVNDVIGEYLQPGLTLENAMESFKCSENTLIDYLARNIMAPHMNMATLVSNATQQYNIHKQEYNSISLLGANTVVELPDGTQTTGSTNITYTAYENGEKVFKITSQGKTTSYTVTVRDISHNCLNENDWSPCDDGIHHENICKCTSRKIIEEHKESSNWQYLSNGDGTHRVYYECEKCHENVTIEEREECSRDDESNLCILCGH